MKKPKQQSFIDPSYSRTSHGHRKIDGVWFYSYHTGILRYAQISADGQVMVSCANMHRDGAATFVASVIGHGSINSPSGKPKRFRSEAAACLAALKIAKAREAAQ